MNQGDIQGIESKMDQDNWKTIILQVWMLAKSFGLIWQSWIIETPQKLEWWEAFNS